MARPQKPLEPINLYGYWYLIRYTPKQFANVDSRRLIRHSTGIAVVDDPRGTRARIAIRTMDENLHRSWRDKLSGKPGPQHVNEQLAKMTALRLGIPALREDEVIELPVDDLMARLAHLNENPQTAADELVAKVVAGFTAGPQQVLLSNLVDRAEHHLSSAHHRKSPAQRKKWRQDRDTTITTFIKVLGGDKPIADLQRADILQLRNYWQNRVTSEGITVHTANKNIMQISAMYNLVNDIEDLRLPRVFDKANLIDRGSSDKKRIPYAAEYIQNTLLNPATLRELNQDCRDLIYVITETGARLSEVVNLDRQDIHLDAPIPYINIVDRDRELKSLKSRRCLPLVGVALVAMRRHPDGFARYKQKENAVSANINKFLTNHNLRPAGKLHSLYSLRHSLKDRLQKVNCDYETRENIMGHEIEGIEYGLGADLETMHHWLAKIAFRVPDGI